MVPVNEKLVLDDGARKVEVYRVHPSDHVDTLLMVHLPAEKLLIQADAFTPEPPSSPPPAPPNNTTSSPWSTRSSGSSSRSSAISRCTGESCPGAELYRAAGR